MPRWCYAVEAVMFAGSAALLGTRDMQSLVVFMFGFCCAVASAQAAGKLP